MTLSRRKLLSGLALAAAAAWIEPAGEGQSTAGLRPEPLTLNPGRLTPFVDPLPRPPRARALGPGRYRIEMRQADVLLHRDLPPTRCWVYNDGSGPASLPGPVIEARSGDAIAVEWVNALPTRHFLPIDHTIAGAGLNVPDVRAVVHMHGARVPAASDGYPEDWTVPGQTQNCVYPNRQAAALLFYHDHAMGINRLNIYAGMFGLMALRDETEAALRLPAGEFEMPLVLFDRWLTPTGQLFYPVSGITGKPWVPEVFGNALLVNGKLKPFMDVEPRAYRFRVLNIANARFFRLSLSSGQPIQVIGSDQGFLGATVGLERLLLAPAERADVIVDFSGQAGQRLLLLNDGITPLLQFRVRAATAAPLWRPPILPNVTPLPVASAVRRRPLTLEEYDGGNGQPKIMLCDRRYWHDPVTEKPELNTTEVWEFLNLSGDTHPIHLHLVRFQILDRQPFDVDRFMRDRSVRFTGPSEIPAPEESGWKDTVRAPAGAVTRIIVRFEGYAGRYLWHCHILEHESNQMMRPYDVIEVSS